MSGTMTAAGTGGTTITADGAGPPITAAAGVAVGAGIADVLDAAPLERALVMLPDRVVILVVVVVVAASAGAGLVGVVIVVVVVVVVAVAAAGTGSPK